MIRLCTLILALTCAVPAAAQPRDQYITVNNIRLLLGNSTGGRVVQVFAGLHPELVRGLIVEDVGPERPRSIADNFREAGAGRSQRVGFGR